MMPTYQKIAEDLRTKIYGRTYAPGDKLPTEYEMCSIYETSRGTLKKALESLCKEGMITQIPGRGTFVEIKIKNDFEEKRAGFLRPENGEKDKIAVLVPNITESLYPEIVKGIEDGCHEYGYHCLIGNCDVDPGKEEQYMREYAESEVTGMIISPSYNSHKNSYYSELKKQRVPFVLTDVNVPGVSADLVCSDNIEGAYLSTKRLIECGCRKIAFVSGWMSSSSSQERLFGLRKAFLEHGISEDPDLIAEGDYTRAFGYEVLLRLIRDREVDGILCANEPITNGIVDCLKEHWTEGDVSSIRLASFDQPVVPDFLKANTILIGQRRYEIGYTALQLLLEKINGSPKPVRKILIEPEIVEYIN